ncbi:V-type proton ATPase subunit e2-like isoform X1 [Vigna unguiculata]|nr:V-type proton ATPase subunit e2-like isoform X1 [Vigna unguiculata]
MLFLFLFSSCRNSFSVLSGSGSDMGFSVTTLVFAVIGIVASLCTRICFNRGPSSNLFHLTLVLTATICCWMMWAIVYLAQMKPLIVPILSEGE